MNSTLAKRIALPSAAVAALAVVPLLTASPAQAGTYCTVVHDNAPIYEQDRVDSKIVDTIDSGMEVAATGPFNMWKVSRADNGAALGYMQQADLKC